MPASMPALADDLAGESAELRALLARLTEADWRRATPAVGWTIADQVSHLAHFDDEAVRSAVDPVTFTAERDAWHAQGGIDPDAIAAGYRSLPAGSLLTWFDDARDRLLEVFRGLDPSIRVPWYGPPMSAASALTARIMETWAHGQDVADALGVEREPTGRLRHVAHIGVGARAFSFAAHGLPVPGEPIRVELAAPGGGVWTWGPPDAPDRVTGRAQDFCLAVTQRRHRDDCGLNVLGPAASAWMEIAQAFAGAPGTGREPGAFTGRAPRWTEGT